MSELPPGWDTDLAVLRSTGSLVKDYGDHVVVRTPDNPDYHWGNFILVVDAVTVDDADRWVERFRFTFPTADWLAIGLVTAPADPTVWEHHGLKIETDTVLTTRTPPLSGPLPQGYIARQLTSETDWAQAVERDLEENARTGEHEPESFERFARRRRESQRRLDERGGGAWFGAFQAGRLVADLGVVRCGTTARYQHVGTRADHRRRGLARHLLGVASRWSTSQGCDRWVICTESDNPAGILYRSVGFEPDLPNVQVWRAPARD